MTSLELANAIQTRFKAEVADVRDLQTVYDNDPTPAPTDASIWCRLTIRDGDSRRITIGVRSYRTVGVAIAQLFGPVGDGTKALREHADAIADAFRDVTAAGVRYGVPAVQNIGVVRGVYQINVNCPFQADTVES